jgi:hypothetical protein
MIVVASFMVPKHQSGDYLSEKKAHQDDSILQTNKVEVHGWPKYCVRMWSHLYIDIEWYNDSS